MGETKIKLGVFGAGRGAYLANVARQIGFELVALCDVFEAQLRHAKKTLGGDDKGITYYTDYDKFLQHDFDAVILANYATQHAPAAVKALKAGKHVMSECMAMFTMGEAVELVEAVEESGLVYSFAENYPYSAQNLEMARLVQSGEMGKFLYGEGEYIHPVGLKDRVSLTSGPEHWRAWMPITYYSTHSMGPIMRITGTRPVRVNGFVVPHDFDDPHNQGPCKIKIDDCASILMCQMDNGALAKVMPCAKLRDHGNRFRICCNRGTMEWNQGNSQLRVRRMHLDWPGDQPETEFYDPKFPEEFANASGFGHGGGDFFTNYFFAEAIRGHRPVDIDVYKAIDMTAIGILGYKSALQHGVPMEIVDFHDKKAREVFRGDDWNPDPSRPCKNKPFSSVLGKLEYSDDDLAEFRRLRKEYEENL